MKWEIKVIPNAAKSQVTERGENWMKVKIAAPAQDGKANKALLKFLAKEFGVSPSRVKLLRGEKSRVKVVEIGE